MNNPSLANAGLFCGAPSMARSALIGAVPTSRGGGWTTRWCKSTTGPVRGTVSRTARVSIVRWNLKEAAGKTLA